jgi:HKD family nuclease
MGNNQQKQKVNFEDVQFVIKNADNHLLINTMLDNLQNCLIVNTMPIDKEELIINKLLNNGDNKNIKIIIYGKNSNDETPIKKYEQLLDLGFSNIYIYTGGLFEWLLLQDIYGSELFPTTSKQNDLLKYKSQKMLNVPLIEF